MSYYEEKRRVFNHIEKLLKRSEEGIEEDFLIYDITKRFTIGEFTIKKRIKLLEKIKLIENIGGVILWKKEASQNQ